MRQLLLPAGQLCWIALFEALHLQKSERLRDMLLCLRGRHAAHTQTEAYILGHVHPLIMHTSGIQLARGVCTENLSTAIVVMKSAQDGARTYDAGSLNQTRDRRILVQ
jgi:hypothetical protein